MFISVHLFAIFESLEFHSVYDLGRTHFPQSNLQDDGYENLYLIGTLTLFGVLLLRMKNVMILLFVFSLSFIHVAKANTSYSVLAGQTITIDEHGICKKITNSGSRNIFVPTKSISEWSSFLSNSPTGINLSNCSISCGSFQSNKYCSSTNAIETVLMSATQCLSRCEELDAACCALTVGNFTVCQPFSTGGLVNKPPVQYGSVNVTFSATLCN